MGKFSYSIAGPSRKGFCPQSTPRAASPSKPRASALRRRMDAQNRSQNNIVAAGDCSAQMTLRNRYYFVGEFPSASGLTLLLFRVVFQVLSPHQESAFVARLRLPLRVSISTKVSFAADSSNSSVMVW